MNPLEKRVLYSTFLGHSISHVYILILAGSLIPITQSFGKSITEITRVATFGYMLYGLGAFPAGILAERTNAKLTLRLYFLLSGLISAMIGLTQSYSLFAAGIILLGLVGSLYHVSGLTLISHCIEKRGKALGIHGIAGSAGIALTPLLAGAVTAVWGWREVYLFMAAPGLAGFLFLTLDRTIPEAHIHARKVDSSIKKQDLPVSMILLFVLVMAVNGLIYRGFMTMFPTYMAERVSIENVSSLVAGGFLTTVILSIGMVGQYVGGTLSDRFPMIRLYFVTVAMTLPFMLLIGLSGNIGLILAALGFALFHFPQQPIENHLIARLIPPRFVSWGYGIKFTLTFGAGSVAAGLAGWITDGFGIENVFLGISLLIAISALLLFVLLRRNEHLL